MDEIKTSFKFDISSFSLDNSGLDMNLNLNKKFNTRYVKPKYIPERKESQIKYRYAIDLARALELSKGMRIHCVVDGTFIFGDFIEALLTERNIGVTKMTICTLSLSEANVDSLHNLLISGHLKVLNIIVSDFFYSHERNNLIPYLYEKLDINETFQLAVCRSHMKVTTMQTDKGNKIVIHGSANMRSSDNLEQFTIEEGEELHNFYNDMFDEILINYGTINKTIRGKTLWDLIT